MTEKIPQAANEPPEHLALEHIAQETATSDEDATLNLKDDAQPYSATEHYNNNPPNRRRLRLAIGAGIAILSGGAIALGVLSNPTSQPPLKPKQARPFVPPSCDKLSTPQTGVNAPLSVVGNHIVDPLGQRFIPYGISIMGGLSQNEPWRWSASDDAQIRAAAKYWYANTIRLQVNPNNLFTDVPAKHTYNLRFLTEIQSEVNLAKMLGMRTVINAQTEQGNKKGIQIEGGSQVAANPNAQTVRFWSIVAPAFRCQQNVMFDLFNEPRAHAATENQPQEVWDLWLKGGTLDRNRYIGMQTLVNLIRNDGVNNIIWVEPPYKATDIKSFAQHPIKGRNIVDSYHHINFKKLGKSESLIASLATNNAVVDGEWAQYASPTRKECSSSAYMDTPQYLSFLRQHNIGLIAWSLQYNSLVKGPNKQHLVTDIDTGSEPTNPADLKNPTRMLKGYACDKQSVGEGAGYLIMNDFKKSSGRYLQTNSR